MGRSDTRHLLDEPGIDFHAQLDPRWVNNLVADTHQLVQLIRKARGLPEWDFAEARSRTDDKRELRTLRQQASQPKQDVSVQRQYALKSMVPVPADIAGRLISKQRKNGYSLFGCARRIGICAQMLQKLQRSRLASVRPSTLAKVLQFLGDDEPADDRSLQATSKSKSE